MMLKNLSIVLLGLGLLTSPVLTRAALLAEREERPLDVSKGILKRIYQAEGDTEKTKVMLKFGELLGDLCAKGNYSTILSMVEGLPPSLMPFLRKLEFQKPSMSDLEKFHYNFYSSVGTAFLQEAKNNLAEAKKYYEVRALLDNYYSTFENFNSQFPKVNDRIKHHSWILYGISSEAGARLMDIFYKPEAEEHSPELEECLQWELKINKKREELLELTKNSPLMRKALGEEGIEEQKRASDLQLLKIYTNLFQIKTKQELNEEIFPNHFTEEKERYSTELKKLKKTLKGVGYRDEVKSCGQILEAANQANRAAVASMSSHIKKRQEREEKKYYTFFQESAQKVQGLNRAIHPKLEISSLQLSIEKLKKDIDSREQIREFEDKVRATIPSSSGSPSLSLEDIYLQYGELMGSSDSMKAAIFHNAISFLVQGDIEEALSRILILAVVDQKEKKSVSLKTRGWISFVKALTGDFEEYLKVKPELEEKEEARERKKERKRAGRAEAIRAEQEMILQQAQADLRAREEAKLEATQKGKQPRGEDSLEEEAAALALMARAAEARRQEEEERVRRHEEAIRIRSEEEAKRALEVARPVVAPVPLPPPAAPVEILPDIPLRALYGLTGRPLAVEEEIEENTWRSTREEIDAYFEALGCTLKAGKGSHGKVQLPAMQEIEVNGQLILLVPESGGALTLPPWEDTVPFYLRKQILKAREILRNLALERERVVGAQ